jgi:hypothetical protein
MTNQEAWKKVYATLTYILGEVEFPDVEDDYYFHEATKQLEKEFSND